MKPKVVFSEMKSVDLYMTGLSIDTVCGLYLYLKNEEVDVAKVRIVHNLEDVGEHSLEFDTLQRYNASKQGSATELYAVEHTLGQVHRDRLVESGIPGLVRLVGMLADNNGKGRPTRGGYLKNQSRFKQSFAWLLREVDDIPLAQADDSAEARTKFWLTAIQRVISTYFAFSRRMSEHPDFHHDLDGFRRTFPEITETLKINWHVLERPEGLFDLSGYLVARFSLLNEEERTTGLEVIRQEYAFWSKAFAQAEEIEAATKKEAETVKVSRNATPAGEVVIVKTDNRALARFLWRRFGTMSVLFIRRSDGHVTIQSRGKLGVNLIPLAQRLKAEEPDIWHHEVRMRAGQMLLNGSGKVQDVRATALTDAELLRYMQMDLKQKPRGSRFDKPDERLGHRHRRERDPHRQR